MYLPATFATALALTILSTICWGSWANTYKGTRRYRFELFYWDYILGILLMALLLAVTLGSFGSGGQPFLQNLRSADAMNLAAAFVGGFLFNIANLLLVAGIDLAGLSVAFPIAIGIAVVEGVVLSYLLQPKGNAQELAAGVGFALIAILMDAMAYRQLTRQGGGQISRKGIAVNIIAGLLMGTFAPFVTRAMTRGHALTPYTVSVLFAVGALTCCFVVNVYFMRHPLVGDPVDFSGYRSASKANHALGVLGGAVWGLGGGMNFIAAGFVGVAISYAIGQAAPMIAALWGVLAWKEFAGAPRKAYLYLSLMFAFYLLAIGTIGMAYRG